MQNIDGVFVVGEEGGGGKRSELGNPLKQVAISALRPTLSNKELLGGENEER